MGRLRTWAATTLLRFLAESRADAPTGRIDLAPVLPGQAQYPTAPTFLSILRQGYRKNATFKACVEVIASATAEAPLRVYTEKKVEVPNHPTRRLMRRPNPFLSETQLWELTSHHFDLVGNAFWHKVRAASGQVVELWPLRPDRVKIVAHPTGFIIGYLYCVGQGGDVEVPVQDILHFPGLRLGDDFFGEPPFLAGLRDLDSDNEAVDFVKAMLQNGAVPGHFIETETTTLDAAVVKAMEAKWQEKFGGQGRGKPLFGTKGMKVTRVGLDMEELNLDGVRGLTTAGICTAMRVPPILIAAKIGLDTSHYANFEIARLALHDDRIAPRHRLFADIIDGDPDLGDGVNAGTILKFDLSEVPAVQGRVLKRREAARLDFQGGILRLDEARAEGGFPPAGGEEGNAFRPAPTPLLGLSDPVLAQLLRRSEVRTGRTVDPVELLAGPLGKVDFAETYLGRLTRQARKTFGKQAAEVLDAWKRKTRADDISILIDDLVQEVLSKQTTWAAGAKKDFAPLLRKVVGGAADLAAKELAEGKPDFTIPPDRVEGFVDEYTFRFAQKISSTSVERVRQVLLDAQSGEVTVKGVSKALRGEFRDWDQFRSVMVARTETIRAANEGARLTYEEAGIEEMEWLAADDSCPICLTLNGRKVRVDEGFLKLGETMSVDDPGEDSATFTPAYEAVTAPPAHPHCRCTIIPVVNFEEVPMKTRAGAVAEERLSFPLEQGAVEFRFEHRKGIDIKVFTKVKGYATTWRTIDALGEEMVKGAFAKTIQERVAARRVKLCDSHFDDRVLGTVTVAKEDAHGVWIEAEVSATDEAQRMAQLVDEGHLKWFSIGFRTIREEYIQQEGCDYPLRRILEAKLYEVSLVAFPADEECEIAAVRSVVPFQDLPLAPADTPWDAAAARARVLEACGGKADAKFRRAFAWSDRRDPGGPDSCQVQVADIVEGKMVVVPRAVLDADLSPVPEEARAAVRDHLARYLERIRTASPGAVAAWEDRGCLESLALLARSGVSDEVQKKRVLSVLGALPDQVRQELTASLTAAPPPPGARTVDELTAAEARARAISLSLIDMGG